MVFHPVPLFHSSTHYEELSRRVHRQINSSAAQATRRTIIVRQSGERIATRLRSLLTRPALRNWL